MAPRGGLTLTLTLTLILSLTLTLALWRREVGMHAGHARPPAHASHPSHARHARYRRKETCPNPGRHPNRDPRWKERCSRSPPHPTAMTAAGWPSVRRRGCCCCGGRTQACPSHRSRSRPPPRCLLPRTPRARKVAARGLPRQRRLCGWGSWRGARTAAASQPPRAITVWWRGAAVLPRSSPRAGRRRVAADEEGVDSLPVRTACFVRPHPGYLNRKPEGGGTGWGRVCSGTLPPPRFSVSGL